MKSNNNHRKVKIISEIHPQHHGSIIELKRHIHLSLLGGADMIKVQLYSSQKLFKNNDYINMSNRGVKNYYLDNIKNPICCISSLNIQNIYNVIRKDLSL